MLRAPWNELVSSVIHPFQYAAFSPSRLRYLWDFTRWQLDAHYGPRIPAPGPQRLTVILLSYKRVSNMEPLARSLLRADFVERILISNNNPEYRISDWLDLRDDRLRWVDQPSRRPAGLRFELARSEPGEYFACIDDDIFLSPEQVRQLFSALIADPSVPHGVHGEYYEGAKGPRGSLGWRPSLGWRRGAPRERRVDGLNGVFFFTREQLEELHRLASALGLEVGDMANGEDLLLSFSGRAKPLIHDIGHVAACLSLHRKGVATWRTRENFYRERTELLMRLRALKAGSHPGLAQTAS